MGISFFAQYKKNLNLALFLGILLGVLLGYFFADLTTYISWIGKLFLSSLKLLIVPVIFVSLLSGILNLNSEDSLLGIGVRTFAFYFVTTCLAVVTGLILVNLMEPGNLDTPLIAKEVSQVKAESSLNAVLLNIVPDNIVSAASSGNILGLIFFTLFLGVALRACAGSNYHQTQQIVNHAFEALIWMIDKIMLVAPIGVMSLVSDLVANLFQNGQLAGTGIEIFWYSLTVLSGLVFHALITLGLILIVFRYNPIKFFKAMLPALITSFSTASSAATLPITIDALEKRAGIPNKIASFVASLGATINMDGTAIYEAVAAIFIANMYGVELSFSQQFVIFLTATFSAVGAAGIPGAGLVMMTMVLNSVGLPTEGISLIVVVDRLLDMFRTSVNVWGDSIGAAVVCTLEKRSINGK